MIEEPILRQAELLLQVEPVHQVELAHQVDLLLQAELAHQLELLLQAEAHRDHLHQAEVLLVLLHQAEAREVAVREEAQVVRQEVEEEGNRLNQSLKYTIQ